jgi:hypothetical protein
MGVKRGVKKYTRFDFACQTLAIIGIILWRVTNNPTSAVAIAVIVDLIAALPTWRHAWDHPFAETWEGFAWGGVAAILTLLTLTSYSFIDLAFPLVILFICGSMTTIVLMRRQQHPRLQS